ncbi:MAG: HEAT repeat domain-containing protein [Planctomycetaceae bacterium]|nr:HEAT repeat domain-containing protein [Planctomycetaceae bacterium]
MRHHISIVILNLGWLLVTANVAWPQLLSDKSSEQLIAQLSDSDVVARRDAIYELVNRGQTNQAVIDAYMAAAQDKDVQVRIQGLTGLARAGKLAEPAVNMLLERLEERDNQVRLRVVHALGNIGSPAIEPLLDKWANGSREFKVTACAVFEAMGPVAKPAIPMLAEAMNADDVAHSDRRRERTDSNRRSTNNSTREISLHASAAAALVAIEPTEPDLLLSIANSANFEARAIGISALGNLADPSPEILERFKRALSDEATQVREVAVIVVAKSKLSMAEKETLMEAALLDSEASVRSAANIGMRQAKLGGAEFAKRLASRLPRAEHANAVSMLEALSSMGSASRVAVNEVLACLQRFGVADDSPDDDPASAQAETGTPPSETTNDKIPRELAVAVLASMGSEAVADLLQLVSQQPELEPLVSEALTQIGQPAIDVLLRGMQDNNPTIRLASVRAMGGMEPLTEKGMTGLIAATTDANAELRATSLAALVRFVNESEPARTAIMTATNDETAAVRAVAFAALGEDGFSREQRRTGLQRGLSDASAEVRVATLSAIAKTPGQMQRQAGTMLELAAAHEAEVRLATFRALASVPKEVVSAGQFVGTDVFALTVLRALRDESTAVRAAATALLPIFELLGPEYADALTENLAGPKELVIATLEVLPKFSAESINSVERLQPLLKHESSEVRIAAVTAVATADRDALRLTKSLLPMLDDPEWVVRRIAGQTLGRQGSVAVMAVPRLFDLLGRHEDKDYAGEALRQIDATPPEFMPTLIENIDSADRRKAFYAVTLLAKLGPAAASAIPKLEAILQADAQAGVPLDEFRRNTIRETIAKLQPTTENQ